MRCLAEAIYFELRSEPEEGQAAVAQVVLNRVRSGIYPTTVCGVVYQDRNRPFACQFTFACEGKSLRIEEPGPWAVATRIAETVVSGANYNAKVGVAVNYHANYVSPFWVGYLKRVDRIGAHIFYAMRDGVNWAPGRSTGGAIGLRSPIETGGAATERAPDPNIGALTAPFHPGSHVSRPGPIEGPAGAARGLTWRNRPLSLALAHGLCSFRRWRLVNAELLKRDVRSNRFMSGPQALDRRGASAWRPPICFAMRKSLSTMDLARCPRSALAR